MRSFQVISGENALAQQFINLRHDAKGAANLLVHQQLGAIALSTNPTNSQTLTLDINGTNVVITFVTSIGSTAGNVLIGASAAATAANLIALLNQPQTTTSTGVSLSAADQTLVSYLSWPLVGTTVTPCSNNTSLYAPLTSFSASTTVTSGTWTAQTMQLFVEPGVVYVGGTRIIFAGGSTPTVTAPSSHPRIDVLAIDNTGTLAWTTGTEASSPSAPTYPANKVALIELYNVVSETALYDFENQQSGEGYVYNDVRPLMGTAVNLGAVASDILPDATNTRDIGSSSFEWNAVYAANFYIGGSPIKVSSASYTAGAALSAGNPVYMDYDSSCVSLNGSSQYLSSTGTNLGIAGDFTLECWVNFSSLPGSGSFAALVSKFTQLTNGYFLSLYNNSGTQTLNLIIGNGSNTQARVNWTPTTSTWYHVALVYSASAGSATFYVNGAIQGTTQTGLASVTASSANFEIGGGSTGTQFYFPGYIEAVRVWSVARTGTAIAADYNLLLSGAESNLVGYWTLHGTLNDRTSNGYTLTNNGSATFSSTSLPGLTGQYVFPTSAATSDTCTTFFGFAIASASALGTVAVQFSGVVSGLTGVSLGELYISNTAGALATSAGSVSRKAAIGLTSTSFLITNIW